MQSNPSTSIVESNPSTSIMQSNLSLEGLQSNYSPEVMESIMRTALQNREMLESIELEILARWKEERQRQRVSHETVSNEVVDQIQNLDLQNSDNSVLLPEMPSTSTIQSSLSFIELSNPEIVSSSASAEVIRSPDTSLVDILGEMSYNSGSGSSLSLDSYKLRFNA
jgi:hypothetical protein